MTAANAPTRPAEPVSLDAVERDLAEGTRLSAQARQAVLLRCSALLTALAATEPPATLPLRAAEPPEQFVTAEEAARLLGVSVRWIYRNKRKLPFVRPLSRKRLQVSVPALQRWQQAQRHR